MDTPTAIRIASEHLQSLQGHIFDVLAVRKPVSPEAALNLAKIISKLSPMVGNLIEFNTVEILNENKAFDGFGSWRRQDPGFPDTIFHGKISPVPGLEIKAWFPLATEITARFKDSQNHFENDNTYVVLMAWLPEELISGRPQILSVCVVSGKSVAVARDTHYHNPPDYIVLEPENTDSRTRNLQQTNTNGYKWQGTAEEFRDAERLVASWGQGGRDFKPNLIYQKQLRQLIARFNYRLDTNFAKMDRIVHVEIEEFKRKVMNLKFKGMTVGQWSRLFASENDQEIVLALSSHLNITDQKATKLVQ